MNIFFGLKTFTKASFWMFSDLWKHRNVFEKFQKTTNIQKSSNQALKLEKIQIIYILETEQGKKAATEVGGDLVCRNLRLLMFVDKKRDWLDIFRGSVSASTMKETGVRVFICWTFEALGKRSFPFPEGENLFYEWFTVAKVALLRLKKE